MKKLIFSIIFVQSIVFQAFSAQTDVELFNDGNKAYIDKKYTEAIKIYEDLCQKGFRSADLFYNTGNAYFKAGNYAKAILFYERAKLIDPSNPDIEFNLTKARAYVIDKIEVIPDFFIKSWFRTTISGVSPNSWAMLSLVCFVVFTVLLLIYLLVVRVNLKKISFYIGIISLIISIVSLTFAYKTRHYIEKSNSAIVMTPTVSVKSSPDPESKDTFVIHEGTKVFILRTLNGWDEIKLTDGKQGWLESQSIEKI